MTDTLATFGIRMRRRGRQLKEARARIIRKVALAADQAVVLATPVDTGRARSNWLASLETPRTDVIPPYTPLTGGTDPSKVGEGANAQQAINQARAVILSAADEQTIVLTNNVDYIRQLNVGSSAQAPANFVQLAVIAAAQSISGVRVFRN